MNLFHFSDRSHKFKQNLMKINVTYRGLELPLPEQTTVSSVWIYTAFLPEDM